MVGRLYSLWATASDPACPFRFPAGTRPAPCASRLVQSWQKLSNSFNPTAPDFSGWNCTPKTFSCSTAAENFPPYSHSATVAASNGTRKEWVKYTKDSDGM